MRSGPSAAITSCSARRHLKRNGGPSGTSATASIGSGRVSSRNGRGAEIRFGAVAAERLPAVVGAGHLRRHARRRRSPEYGCPARSAGARGARPAARSSDRPAGRARPASSAPPMPICSGGARLGHHAPTAAPCRSRSRDRARRPARPAARQTARGWRPDRATAASSRRRCGAARRRCGTSVSSMRRAPSPRRSSATCSRPASRVDAGQHVLLARDRLGKALLGDVRRNRQPRIERLVLGAQRAVELAQQLDAEARGQGRARQVDDIADAFQADARQRRHRRRRRAAARRAAAAPAVRARRRRHSVPARRNARRPMRRADGAGDRHADRQSRRASSRPLRSATSASSPP